MENTQTLEELRKEGQGRLYPSLTNPNWLVLRKRRLLFEQWLGQLSSTNLQVLDVGGRVQPYRPLIANACARYVALDSRPAPSVDVVGTGEDLPFDCEEFDLVLCTQVLEYVPNPGALIAEIHRVLKPGGCLLLSAPAVWLIDSEHECWRFLPAGLRHLLASFGSVEIAPEGNSLVGLIRTISVWIVSFARPAPLRALLQFTLVPCLNVAGVASEYVFPNKNYAFSANFSVLARK